MKRFIILFLIITGMALLTHFAWPWLRLYAGEIINVLIIFKKFCAHNPWMGYVVFITTISVIIAFGLPLSTALMLLAGIVFGFWEATTLVMVGRFVTAMMTFLFARDVFMESKELSGPGRIETFILRRIEYNPKLSVLLMRLAPIPDTLVNYSLAAMPVSKSHYAFMTLIGMIPFTVLCVGIGQRLGSVSQLISYLS